MDSTPEPSLGYISNVKFTFPSTILGHLLSQLLTYEVTAEG